MRNIHNHLNQQMFYVVLDSGAEVTLIHTRICKLSKKPKLKKKVFFSNQ